MLQIKMKVTCSQPKNSEVLYKALETRYVDQKLFAIP